MENPKLKCRQCDASVQANQAEDSDGNPLCQDCADVLCRWCGLSTGHHEVEGVLVCDSCFENRFCRYDHVTDRYWD